MTQYFKQPLGNSMQEVAEVLMSIVESESTRLSQISDQDASQRPAPGKWSKKEVRGHLIDSASNNHQRFVRAQAVDALIFPKYEQEFWVGCQRYDKEDWRALISLWSAYNRHIAHVIQCIDSRALGRQCKIGDYEPVTLEFLVHDYVGHIQHHMKQIA